MLKDYQLIYYKLKDYKLKDYKLECYEFVRYKLKDNKVYPYNVFFCFKIIFKKVIVQILVNKQLDSFYGHVK